MDAFAATVDAQNSAEIQPGEVGIGAAAGCQVEREIRRGSQRIGACGDVLQPPGRFLEKSHRTHQHRCALEPERRQQPRNQTHVVIEGQPRDHGQVTRRHAVEVFEVVGSDLAEVADHVLVGDHHPCRLPGRS